MTQVLSFLPFARSAETKRCEEVARRIQNGWERIAASRAMPPSSQGQGHSDVRISYREAPGACVAKAAAPTRQRKASASHQRTLCCSHRRSGCRPGSGAALSNFVALTTAAVLIVPMSAKTALNPFARRQRKRSALTRDQLD
eukprot:scaffold1806_cov240-Pinguiococcus_pyrenoidosus.AAC.7